MKSLSLLQTTAACAALIITACGATVAAADARDTYDATFTQASSPPADRATSASQPKPMGKRLVVAFGLSRAEPRMPRSVVIYEDGRYHTDDGPGELTAAQLQQVVDAVNEWTRPKTPAPPLAKCAARVRRDLQVFVDGVGMLELPTACDTNTPPPVGSALVLLETLVQGG